MKNTICQSILLLIYIFFLSGYIRCNDDDVTYWLYTCVYKEGGEQLNKRGKKRLHCNIGHEYDTDCKEKKKKKKTHTLISNLT